MATESLDDVAFNRMTGTKEVSPQQASPAGISEVSYRVKLMYAVGDIANSIKVVTFGLYSLFFATVVMGLPGTLVGVIGFFAILWDALIDPLIGHITDGAQDHSRRYTFMLIGALTMGVGYWAFFSPPRNLPIPMLFAWLLAASLIARGGNSMFTVPYYAVGASLSTDYNERTSIAGLRGLMGAIGTGLAASLSFVVFFPDKVPGMDPKLNYAGYVWMGLIFGFAMTAVALISIAGTLPLRRRISLGVVKSQQPPGQFFRSMSEAVRNPSFRIILMSYSLIVIGLALSGTLLLHYLSYYVEVSGSAAVSSTQAAFFAGGLAGTLLWLRVSARFDKHKLYIFSTVVTSVLMAGAMPLFGKGHLFGTGDVRPLLIGYGLTGFFNCILWFIPASMLADVADEAELTSGRRSDGALFGLFSLGQQIATGIAIMLAGVLLDRFAGLVPGNAQQSESTAYRIGVLYGIVPAALFVCAAILMLRYSLTRSRIESIQAELRERKLTLGSASAGVNLQ